MQQRVDLTGLWRFQPDPYGEGEKAGYPAAGHDVSRWREVRVPCAFDECGPGMASYEGGGWFRRPFDVPEAWRGRRVALRFEGVNYHARVWVNGTPVGRHEDGFLPFGFSIEHAVRFGEENVLVVWADNTRRPGEVPGMERGWRPFGGILREVSLLAGDPCRLAGLRVMAEPAAEGGSLSLKASLVNDRPRAAHVGLSVEIRQGENVLAEFAAEPALVDAGAESVLRLSGIVPGARPWSPESPALYSACVRLRVDGDALETRELRVGFRRIERHGTQLLLNDKPIFLTGFNRHEDSPRTGPCPDLEMVRRDLLEIKGAHANFVRLCHYPHHPGELALCDELGLLAMCEIPVYWWNGLAEGEESSARKLEAAKRQMRALIERDGNHPSVIFWSVSNETHEQRPEVASGNAALVRVAREMDPTRLAVHVSSRWQDEPHFAEDDLLCVNDYPAWGRRGYSAERSYDLADAGAFWARNLEKLHAAYPDKPILVTEFGYPCLEGVLDNALGEEIQARALEAEFRGMSAPYVCGATVWCYADHPWPEEPFVRYLTTSPYGVVSRERRRKRGFETIRRLFAQRQGPPMPAAPAVLRAAEPLSADTPVNMIRPHLREIPQVPLPPGYAMRAMRLGEAALWTDIERDTEQFCEIDDGLFEREFGDDLQATQWRCFFVVNEKGVAVGTLSSWYSRDWRGQEYGRVHWVAIRPAYQGCGLGKAALSYALNRMAEWHERAWLATSTGRLPALKMYLNFGFLPDLDAPRAREAWEMVRARLDHPALNAALEQ